MKKSELQIIVTFFFLVSSILISYSGYLSTRMSSTLESVSIKAGHVEATIVLYGATLTSYKINGKEILFVSKQAILDGSKAIRGGVPVCWPQFGPGVLPQHGFARNTLWRVADRPNESEVTLEMKSSEETAKTGYTQKFVVRMHVRVEAGANTSSATLTQTLEVQNDDAEPLRFTTALHTYYLVNSNIEDVRLPKLKRITYRDKVRDMLLVEGGDSEDLVINDNVDRVYLNALKGGEQVVEMADRLIRLRTEHLNDCVVWNPWSKVAVHMSDFGDEEYTNMLCVEAGAINEAVSVAPKTKWHGSQTINVELL